MAEALVGVEGRLFLLGLPLHESVALVAALGLSRSSLVEELLWLGDLLIWGLHDDTLLVHHLNRLIFGWTREKAKSILSINLLLFRGIFTQRKSLNFLYNLFGLGRNDNDGVAESVTKFDLAKLEAEVRVVLTWLDWSFALYCELVSFVGEYRP